MEKQDKEHKLLSDSELQRMSHEEFMRHQDALFKAAFGKSLSDYGITNVKEFDSSLLLSSLELLKDAPDNHPPKKKNNESEEDYYLRLRDMWGQSLKVKEIHERWKSHHRNGILERDLKQRIYIQLKELLASDFLQNDYIETGMTNEDCADARQRLKDEGWDNLLEVIDGADWKLALLCRHLLEPSEYLLICDASNVGYYISEMQAKLNWCDVEAFFRFDTYMQLVYEDMDALEDDVDFEDEDEGEEDDNELEKGECPKIFDKKLNIPNIKAKLKKLTSDDVKGKRRWYVFYRVFKYLEWTKVTQQTFIAWVAFHFEWDKKQEFRGVPSEFTNNDPPNWGSLVIETKVKDEIHYNYELGPAYYAFAVEIRDAFVTVDDNGVMHDKEDFLVGPRKDAIAHHNTWI